MLSRRSWHFASKVSSVRSLLATALFLILSLATHSAQAQNGDICVDSLPQIKGLNLISGSLISSGLPSSEDFAKLKSANVEAVISVIPPVADEAQPDLSAIHSEGLIFYTVPFDLAAPIAAIESFKAAMNALEGKNLIIFCASNNRASIMLYTHHLITSGEADDSYLKEGLVLSDFLTEASKIYDNFVAPIEKHYGVTIK
ncbi:MAG: hypothetical protein SNG49_08040 [Rikenellaceae bacterium]